MYEIIKEYIKYISKAFIYWLIINTHTHRKIYTHVYMVHTCDMYVLINIIIFP